MKIACTNIFNNAGSIAVSSDDDTNQDIDHVMSPNFSTAYTSAGSNSTFTFTKTITTGVPCRYVALAGHNFSNLTDTPVLTIKVNGVTKGTINFDSSHPANWLVMVHFAEVTATSIEISLAKDASADRATISYVAAGSLLDDAFVNKAHNSEMNGFLKLWANAGRKVQGRSSNSGLPISKFRRSVPVSTTLKIKDLDYDAVFGIGNPWHDFNDLLDTEGCFFMKADDGEVTGQTDEPRTAVLCTEAIGMVKTHGKTRTLVDMSVKFKAVNGYNG